MTLSGAGQSLIAFVLFTCWRWESYVLGKVGDGS